MSGPDADGYYTVVKPQPEINLVSAAQRYPWNSIVDYTYALSNCNASATYKLAVGLTAGGVTKVSTNELTTVIDENYTGTIDASTLFPNTVDKAGKIKLQLIEDVVVSETEGDLVIDTRTGTRTVASGDDILPFAHSKTGWGAGSAAQATITYKLNGGAAQTLGTYADAATATWTPTKSGEYLFTHTPGSDVTARFFVNLLYDGTGTAEDPYLVRDAAGFNEVAAKGGYVTLLDNIAASASVPSGTTLVIDVGGKVLSGAIANEGQVTVNDSNARSTGDFTATVTGSGTLTDNIVRETATIQVLTAQQRYPWNGLVDVAYEVGGLKAHRNFSAIFSVTVEDVGTKTFMVTNVVEGTNATVWDAAAPSAFGTVLTNKIASITAVLYCTTPKGDLGLSSCVVTDYEDKSVVYGEYSSLQEAIDSLDPSLEGTQLIMITSEDYGTVTDCGTVEFYLSGGETWVDPYEFPVAENYWWDADFLVRGGMNTYYYMFGNFSIGWWSQDKTQRFATLQEAINALKSDGHTIFSVTDDPSKLTATAGTKTFALSTDGFGDSFYSDEQAPNITVANGYYGRLMNSVYYEYGRCPSSSAEDDIITILAKMTSVEILRDHVWSLYDYRSFEDSDIQEGHEPYIGLPWDPTGETISSVDTPSDFHYGFGVTWDLSKLTPEELEYLQEVGDYFEVQMELKCDNDVDKDSFALLFSHECLAASSAFLSSVEAPVVYYGMNPEITNGVPIRLTKSILSTYGYGSDLMSGYFTPTLNGILFPSWASDESGICRFVFGAQQPQNAAPVFGKTFWWTINLCEPGTDRKIKLCTYALCFQKPISIHFVNSPIGGIGPVQSNIDNWPDDCVKVCDGKQVYNLPSISDTTSTYLFLGWALADGTFFGNVLNRELQAQYDEITLYPQWKEAKMVGPIIIPTDPGVKKVE